MAMEVSSLLLVRTNSGERRSGQRSGRQRFGLVTVMTRQGLKEFLVIGGGAPVEVGALGLRPSSTAAWESLPGLAESSGGCEFENVEITLRDRIVVGMRDLRLQRKLITKKSISLKEVMEEARAAEILEKPAAKIEKLRVFTQHGDDQQISRRGEIGELSEEEEEEIHRVKPDRRSGPQG
ncbi:hypothetical protein E2320_001622 [Naja naja]|nr:hypothetical protein E2320_001622 [Naja naja]